MNTNPYRQWMAEISGGVGLDRLAIPGSHASASYNLQLGDSHARLHQCQDITIQKQFDAGARVFDITVRQQGIDLQLVHRGFDCSINFSDFIKQCSQLVDRYPSEGIIILLKKENSNGSEQGSFCQILETQCQGLVPFLRNQTHIPTINDLRGKILILRRFDLDYRSFDAFANNPLGMDVNTWPENSSAEVNLDLGKLHIQDQYILNQESGIENKWQAIRQNLEEGILTSTNTQSAMPSQRIWYWNFINSEHRAHSGNAPLLSSVSIAYQQSFTLDGNAKDGLNGQLTHHLNTGGSLSNLRGVFMLDFLNHQKNCVQSSQHLVLSILQANDQYRINLRDHFLRQTHEVFKRRYPLPISKSPVNSALQAKGYLSTSGDYLFYQYPANDSDAQLHWYDMTRKQDLQRLKGLKTAHQVAVRADSRNGYFLKTDALYQISLGALGPVKLATKDEFDHRDPTAPPPKVLDFSVNQGEKSRLVSVEQGAVVVYDLSSAPILEHSYYSVAMPTGQTQGAFSVALDHDGNYAALIEAHNSSTLVWIDIELQQQTNVNLNALGTYCQAVLPLRSSNASSNINGWRQYGSGFYTSGRDCAVVVGGSSNYLYILHIENNGQWRETIKSVALNSRAVTIREDVEGRFILLVCEHALYLFDVNSLLLLWQLDDMKKQFYDAVFDHQSERVITSYTQDKLFHIQEFNVASVLDKVTPVLPDPSPALDFFQH